MSLADELRKLADLVTDGVLTQEEFDEEKARLLAERRRTSAEPLWSALERAVEVSQAAEPLSPAPASILGHAHREPPLTRSGTQQASGNASEPALPTWYPTDRLASPPPFTDSFDAWPIVAGMLLASTFTLGVIFGSVGSGMFFATLLVVLGVSVLRGGRRRDR